MVEEYTRIEPWMRGPYELLRHAIGHLKGQTDTDRRLSLIGFDHAVEVCIDVYTTIHPMLRNNVIISKDDKMAVSKNFFEKVKFLERHFKEQDISATFPSQTLMFVHSLRNELYHSGNGLVPEQHVIDDAHYCAIAVFKALFGLDITSMLEDEEFVVETEVERHEDPQILSGRLHFLNTFANFERVLEERLTREPTVQVNTKISSAELWQIYNGLGSTKTEIVIGMLRKVRNQIAHGEKVEATHEQLEDWTNELQKIVADLQRETISIDEKRTRAEDKKMLHEKFIIQHSCLMEKYNNLVDSLTEAEFRVYELKKIGSKDDTGKSADDLKAAESELAAYLSSRLTCQQEIADIEKKIAELKQEEI